MQNKSVHRCESYELSCADYFAFPAPIRSSFPSANLSGTLPDQLGDFSSLESLDLSNNALVGTIPLSISGIATLQTLDLTGNAMSLHTGKGTDWAVIGKWIAIGGAAAVAVALFNVAATINRNHYILFGSDESQQAVADGGALGGGAGKERVLCGYKFSVNVEAILQSFWYRIDCALQRRQRSGGEYDKSAPTAGDDFLYGDVHHPKWPRSGKVRRGPSARRPVCPPVTGSLLCSSSWSAAAAQHFFAVRTSAKRLAHPSPL